MRLEFSREDLLVQVAKEGISLTSGKVVDRLNVKNPEGLGRELEQSKAVQRWAKRLPSAHYGLIFRVWLDIRPREQQAQDWEGALGDLWIEYAHVR